MLLFDFHATVTQTTYGLLAEINFLSKKIVVFYFYPRITYLVIFQGVFVTVQNKTR